VDPAACARAKKAKRLEREAAMAPPPPKQLPRTPEEAAVLAYREYRRATRPFRSTFRGIISRREAERFFISRARKTARAIQAAQEAS
jgi:hypothetical protein